MAMGGRSVKPEYSVRIRNLVPFKTKGKYMNIVALVVFAGTMLVGPHFDSKQACIEDAQNVGYAALKQQVDKEVKIYCVDPTDEAYTDLKRTEVDRLKAEDLVPEKN